MAAHDGTVMCWVLLVLLHVQPAFVESFTVPVTGECTRMSFATDNSVYVVDPTEDVVRRLAPDGSVLARVGGFGWSIESLDQPADVWVDGLSVFVADKNNHRIVRYDKDLRPISALSTRESDRAEERFGYPVAVAVNHRGDLGIIDSEDDELVVFDGAGKFLFRFGKTSRAGDGIHGARDLTVDNMGNWVVLDSRSVWTVDLFGTLKTQFRDPEYDAQWISAYQDFMVLGSDSLLAFVDVDGRARWVGTWREFLPGHPGETPACSGSFGDEISFLLPHMIVGGKVFGFERQN